MLDPFASIRVAPANPDGQRASTYLPPAEHREHIEPLPSVPAKPLIIRQEHAEHQEHSREDVRALWRERAGVLEFDEGFPREWADGLAALEQMAVPEGIRSDRWHQLVDDAQRFASRWGHRAIELGWSVTDVFGVDHPSWPKNHVFSDDPLKWPDHERYGLVVHIRGDRVVELTADSATIHYGQRQWRIFYRRVPDGGTTLWKLGASRR